MVKSGLSTTGPDAITSFVKGFSKTGVDNFLASGFSMYAATVGPNEALILPFDWVFAEKVADSGDVLGIRVAFFLKADEEAMTSVNRWLISSRKQNNYLLNACEAMVEATAD